MIDLSGVIKGYNPGQPLVATRNERNPESQEAFIAKSLGVSGNDRYDRKFFTPDIQKDIIGAHFGQAPTVRPSTLSTPAVNDSTGIPPEELARLQRLDSLVSKPEVLKAIGDVILGQNVRPNNEPSAATYVAPPAAVVSDPNTVSPVPAPAGVQPTGDEFLDKLWGDMNETDVNTPPIVNQPNANVVEDVALASPAPVVAAPVAPAPVQDPEYAGYIATAEAAGIPAKDFDSFMGKLDINDFISLYKANVGQAINNQRPATNPAPAPLEAPNLVEARGVHRVPVDYSGVGRAADVDRYRV